jgi:serine/threonine-protein kinase
LFGSAASDLAIAADGSFIVYSTTGPLAARRLDQLESRILDGTAGAYLPFVAPDEQWIGFFKGAELMRVPLSGGAPQTICAILGAGRGAAWGEDGTIVFGSSLSNGLMRVPATGGEPTRITTVDAATNPIHGFPSWLPGGNSLLFSILPPTGGAELAMVDAGSGSITVLATNSGIAPRYLTSGHLLTANPGEVRITPFDLRRRALTGEPIVAAEALTPSFAGANFAASTNGVLAYFPPNSSTAAGSRTLVWVDRQGNETPIDAPPRAYEVARVSPDGSRIALDIRDGDSDIWIWEVARRTLARLTTERASDMGPVWAGDGQHLFYTSNTGGIPKIYRRRADGAGVLDQLTSTTSPVFVTSVSPDGSQLALFSIPGAVGSEIGVLPLGGTSRSPAEMRTILRGSGMRFGGEISPDGRWIAFHSTETGQSEVFVRPFPNVDAGRVQISTAGGSRPAWSDDGRELFYLDAANLLVSVPVSVRGDTFSPGSVTPVLRKAYLPGSTARGLDLRSYDVAPDGRRFLMIKEVVGGAGASTAPLVVVTNWFDELIRRVPTRD